MLAAPQNVQYMGRDSTQRLHTEIYEEAVVLIRAECHGQITADKLARRLATSPRQMRRAFAKAGGTSFRERLLEARMARAAELLASTDLPVSEVAREVGYSGPSQFTKAFRRTHGATPSEHRSKAGANRPG
jgi:AraC family transcriptional regulator of adaptative response / methylphosphotriester-DNA alkyltransferase methyltransferase